MIGSTNAGAAGPGGPFACGDAGDAGADVTVGLPPGRLVACAVPFVAGLVVAAFFAGGAPGVAAGPPLRPGEWALAGGGPIAAGGGGVAAAWRCWRIFTHLAATFCSSLSSAACFL